MLPTFLRVCAKKKTDTEQPSEVLLASPPQRKHSSLGANTLISLKSEIYSPYTSPRGPERWQGGEIPRRHSVDAP